MRTIPVVLFFFSAMTTSAVISSEIPKNSTIDETYSSAKKFIPAHGGQTWLALEKIKETPPIPDALHAIFKTMPLNLKSRVLYFLTTCKIIDKLISNSPPEVSIPIGSVIEEAARQYECQYVKKVQASSYYQTNNNARIACPEKYGWKSGVHNVKWLNTTMHIEANKKTTEEQPSSLFILPGTINIYKQLFSDILCNTSHHPMLSQILQVTPLYVYNVGDKSKLYTILDKIDFEHGFLWFTTIRAHKQPFITTKHQYGLLMPVQSISFEEALMHFLAYEIKKLNMHIFTQARRDTYEKQSIPNAYIEKLAAISTSLSYKHNCFLHSMLTDPERPYGKYLAIKPDEKNVLNRLPDDVNQLLKSWGFE